MNREQRRKNWKKFSKRVFTSATEARTFLKTHGVPHLVKLDKANGDIVITLEECSDQEIANVLLRLFGCRIVISKNVEKIDTSEQHIAL